VNLRIANEDILEAEDQRKRGELTEEKSVAECFEAIQTFTR
jgi:hypothetical protein